MIRSRAATRAVAILAGAALGALALGGCAEDRPGRAPGDAHAASTATRSTETSRADDGFGDSDGSWLRALRQLERTLAPERVGRHRTRHEKGDRGRPDREHDHKPRHRTWASHSQ